jgi:uncharacterized membrane protein SpoIIM required for sporulation
MNVERWLKSKRVSWQALEDLLKIVEHRGLKALDRQQLRELGRLYRAASADLSRSRALKLSAEVQMYLNNLVVKAHNQVYQTRSDRFGGLWRFLWRGFPLLVQRYIIYVTVAFALFAIPCLGCYLEAVKDVHFGQMEIVPGHALVSDDLWHMIERKKLWTDSVQDNSPAIASLIATNNIKVAIMAFVFGMTFGLGTVFILIQNGISIGTVFGVCHDYGMAHRLLAFVAGHGVLELTAIFISGGAGLLLGKSLLFPGQLSRADSLRVSARPAMQLFAGCVGLLLVAGAIEGFVSPRTDISAQTKYMVSLASAVCLLLYLFAPRRVAPDDTEVIVD